jgi:hypothetical protein
MRKSKLHFWRVTVPSTTSGTESTVSHLQDLRKAASGLAMVVKESMKMAPRFPPQIVDGSTFKIFKAVMRTVTDLRGLMQGLVKELQNCELGHLHEGEDGGVGRAGSRAGSNVSTASIASGRESHLFNPVDSLGLHRVGLMKWCQE